MGSVEFEELLKQLQSYGNIPNDLTSSFRRYLQLLQQLDQEDRFSKPMPWIGMYVVLASLFCVLAMAADLLHGLQKRKLWLPCRYFTLNAASLTVMAVAMKLPVDLNNPMPGFVDQRAKLGSMAFMCTMMTHLLPSLATMDGKELIANMIALSLLVITMVVNFCIEIQTGLISIRSVNLSHTNHSELAIDVFKITAIVEVSMLLLLLMIYTCTSLAILTSKQMMESKYQQAHRSSSTSLQSGRLSTLLKQYVTRYWIMAVTSSPQFLIISCSTFSASGVISMFTAVFHILIFSSRYRIRNEHGISDYKWSMIVILWIQFIGVMLGSMASCYRIVASVKFKQPGIWIRNHCKVFQVESYWTQMLYNWKQTRVPSPFYSCKCKIVIENLKVVILSVCLVFQKTVVVACKMICLIPLLSISFCLLCSCCVLLLEYMFGASGNVSEQNLVELQQIQELRQYASQIQDQMELTDSKLKGISNVMNRLIRKAEKKQPNDLMKLLAESNGFEGVGKFDSHHVPPLVSQECLNCWSLPLVTLTTIAISLPDIRNDRVDGLLSSVTEGLVYATLVEENLNSSDDYASTRKAAKRLWLEVEVYHKWLGYVPRKLPPRMNTARQILQWFNDTARKTVVNMQRHDGEGLDDDSIYKTVSANLMYRITETILLSHNNNNNNHDEISQEELFQHLSSTIADIFAACLTNLSRVIMIKCHASEVKKRESSVQVAAQVLGETVQIINILEDRELPRLNTDEMAFIGMWWDFYNHPS